MRLALLTILVVGCANPTSREPDEYTGCGDDELWRLLDDDEPHATVDDSRAPSLTQPTGSNFPYSPKPTFMWNQDPNDPGQKDGDVPYLDGTLGCMMCCPQFNTGALTSAHLPPISGDVYDLHFYIDGNYAHRLITTLQEWAPPDQLWQSWKGKTVSLNIYRAATLVGATKEGPFVASKPITFNVGS